MISKRARAPTIPTIRTSQIITPAFYHAWRNCDKYVTKVFKGGRNSGKSTTISRRIIFDLMRLPVNALIVRKVGETLEHSVYAQLLDAVDALGVGAYWEARKSPLSLRYTPTGTQIIFRGADKPEKIKGIKTAKYPISILWIDELDEFKTADEVSVIVNSVIRAELPHGLKYSIYFSYNPPKRKNNWVNKKYNSAFKSDSVFVHHSTYLDNPFTSQAFREEAEDTKRQSPHKFKWIFMGEPIGGGIVPFENLSFRRITDEEIAGFDNIRQGLDWGYAADPLAFVRIHYDKTRRRIYILDEFYGVKISNREAAQWITAHGYENDRIIADSAEPKSVDELRQYGINIAGAKKGAGSVETGERWLDDLEEIVIDYERTPNTAREFENIDYQIDRNGEVKNRLEDKDNHSIDAVRYALSDDIGKVDFKADAADLFVGFGGMMREDDVIW